MRRTDPCTLPPPCHTCAGPCSDRHAGPRGDHPWQAAWSSQTHGSVVPRIAPTSHLALPPRSRPPHGHRGHQTRPAGLGAACGSHVEAPGQSQVAPDDGGLDAIAGPTAGRGAVPVWLQSSATSRTMCGTSMGQPGLPRPSAVVASVWILPVCGMLVSGPVTEARDVTGMCACCFASLQVYTSTALPAPCTGHIPHPSPVVRTATWGCKQLRRHHRHAARHVRRGDTRHPAASSPPGPWVRALLLRLLGGSPRLGLVPPTPLSTCVGSAAAQCRLTARPR